MKAWTAAAIGACLLLGACQGGTEEEPKAPPAADAVQPPEARVTAPDAPAIAGGIDSVLTQVRAYNEHAAKELSAIAGYEARIRAAVGRAGDIARGAEAASESQRQSLTQRLADARRDADAARNQLVDGQVRLRKDTDEQITAVEAMMETCDNDERLAAYEGCVALQGEHEILLKNIDALTARYQAADNVYSAERAKLEEASAAVALAALR